MRVPNSELGGGGVAVVQQDMVSGEKVIMRLMISILDILAKFVLKIYK